jgi:hypothetical protein
MGLPTKIDSAPGLQERWQAPNASSKAVLLPHPLILLISIILLGRTRNYFTLRQYGESTKLSMLRGRDGHMAECLAGANEPVFKIVFRT